MAPMTVVRKTKTTKTKIQKQKPKGKSTRSKTTRNFNKIVVRNLPQNAVTTLTTNPDTKPVRYVGEERIGSLHVTSGSQVGDAWVFKMNPTTLDNTRLSHMSRQYQKFRFEKVSIIVNANFSTATQGSLLLAYANDEDIDLGTDIITSLYALPGTKSCRLWTPTTMAAKFTPGKDWYYADYDSKDEMFTTQGKFIIGLESVPNIESAADISVLLRYTILFAGPTVSPRFPGTKVTMPGAQYTLTDFTNIYPATASDGGTVPTLVNGTIYHMTPNIEVIGKIGLSATASYLVQVDTTHAYWYDSLDNAILGSGSALKDLAAGQTCLGYQLIAVA